MKAEESLTEFEVKIDSIAKTKIVRFPNGKVLMTDLYPNQQNLLASSFAFEEDDWVTHFSWKLVDGRLLEERSLYNSQGDCLCSHDFPPTLFSHYESFIFSNGTWLLSHAVEGNTALTNTGVSNIVLLDDKCNVLFDSANMIHGRIPWLKLKGEEEIMVMGGLKLQSDWRETIDRKTSVGTYLVFIFDELGLLQRHSFVISFEETHILKIAGLAFIHDSETDFVTDAHGYLGGGFQIKRR